MIKRHRKIEVPEWFEWDQPFHVGVVKGEQVRPKKTSLSFM